MKTETMKTQTPLRLKFAATVALAAALFLTGCVVTSVYPFYHAKDVVFDPALIGVWTDASKNEPGADAWTFEQVDDRTYKLTIADGADKKTEFDARLFKLKGQHFLDCLPRERAEGNAPVHYLMRLDALSPKLEFRLLDYDWLAKLLEKNPRAIRHIVVPKKAGDGDGGELILTADTAELQKFLRKHLKTPDAWGEPVAMKKP